MKPQVIPPGGVATYEIVLCSSTPQEFKTNIKYVINGKHNFEFQVYGLIEPVYIEPDQYSLNFKFDDNIDMEVCHKLTLKNKGNATAKFKFKLSDLKPNETRVKKNN